MQQEALTLRRIVGLLRDQQLAIANGATTGEFDRDDSARHRNLERALTNELHAWCLLRQEFQRSPEFLRTALVNEIRQLSTDVDAIVQQNDLAGILTEVCQALQEGESGQHELTTTTAPTAAAAAAPRSCAAQFAAQQLPAGAAGGGSPPYQPATPTRRRTFCLAVGVNTRPAKKARGKQGTPHPRHSAVQAAIDSADEDLDLSDLEAEDLDDLPAGLLSPEAGSVDFGPRSDQEGAGGGDSDWARRGKIERD